MKNILYQESIVEIKHLFRMMRNTLLALFVFAGTAFATESYSQTMKVTVVADNVSTGKVISEIEKQTDYLFVYNVNEVNLKRNVKVNAQNKSVAEVLNKVFEGTDIYYAMEGKNIMLMSKAKDGEVAQQANKVTGIVKDTNGEPIIGANVTVKGQSIGTITDIDGRFVLDAPKNAVLQITYIGYVSQEVKVSGNKELNVVLKEDTETLDEVVVVGFGTQKKVNLTGAVGLATAKELESRPVTSATQALQGLVPGLQISTSTGELDKTADISIRGTGTIGEGSSGAPLILIDGMEGDLNTVNPQDIENISVLKDAAASSIYGSRAPFGVILVTTKSGKKGKTSVNYNNSFRISTPVNMPKMMDSYTFANFMNAGSLNQGGGLIFTEDLMQDMLDWQAAGGGSTGGVKASSNGQWGKPDYDPFTTAWANTNWYDEVYKSSSFSQEHNVSLNGGSDIVAYYASFNYLDQGGLLKAGDDGLHRYNVTAKINADLTQWLKFNYSTRFTRNDVWRPTSFNSSFYDQLGRATWPNMPVKDPNGYYTNNGWTNPVQNLVEGGKRNAQTDRLYQQASLVIEPIKNWITHVEFNYSIMNSSVKETSIPTYNHDVEGNLIDTHGTSYLYQDQTKENYLNLNIYSEYSQSFNNAHNAKVMLGFQTEDMKQEFSSTENIRPDIAIKSGNTAKDKVYFVHRRLSDADVYFLNNHSDRAFHDTVRLRTDARQAEYWDAVTGQRYMIPVKASGEKGMLLNLTLAPRESGFIVTSNNQATGLLPIIADVQETITPIEGSWNVYFDPRWGGPGKVVFDELIDWTVHADTGIRYYSGTTVYHKELNLAIPAQNERLLLRFPRLGSLARVWVNGKEVVTVWCSPWEADITSYVHEGKNNLKIEVVNSLMNRMIGDASLPESERFTYAYPQIATPTDKLVPSGIMEQLNLVYRQCQ